MPFNTTVFVPATAVAAAAEVEDMPLISNRTEIMMMIKLTRVLISLGAYTMINLVAA